MGLFSRNTQIHTIEIPTVDIAAESAPVNFGNYFAPYLTNIIATREQAMSVPSIARARNIICGSISSLPIELYETNTGAHLNAPRVLNQPDPRVPGSYVYAWTCEDLIFYGTAYWQILEQYADTGRIRSATRIAPQRITPIYNDTTTEIVGYNIDGKPTPPTGVGSLVVFYGIDEGILNRAGRTISAAAWLEKAAENYAKEPVPSVVLRSAGSMLPKERILAILQAWKKARSEKATAFLNADVTMDQVGFDPKSLQLTEARQYVATEIARLMNIPAWFLSAETTSLTYSNTTQERKALVDFSLRSVITSLEQRLNQADFTPSVATVKFSLDDFLRGSALERAQVYEILNRIGAMSVEQIQEEEDLIDTSTSN